MSPERRVFNVEDVEPQPDPTFSVSLDGIGRLGDPEEADDAVRGLAGLILLGNAWERIDIFHALNVALQRDSLWLNLRERLLPRPDFVEGEALLDPAFLKLRAEADAWHKVRGAFMTRRLKEGLHPDTDADFWNGYKERPAPGLPTKSVSEAFYARLAFRQSMGMLVIIGVPVLAAGLAAGLAAVRSAKARRRTAHLIKEPPTACRRRLPTST